ncbi:MAG: hypothetical protein ACYSWU_03615 [Planctomycetota bacterium]|jgi:hypothetical protein
MWKRLWIVGGVLGVLLLLMGVPAAAEQKEAVFEMEEISVFEQGGSEFPQLVALAMRGQNVSCSFVRRGDVKKYPELKSSRPVYGSVTFGRSPTAPTTGVRFSFVIDESQPDETETADNKASLRDLAASLGGTPNSGASNRKYDLLYFDANGDLDLTNDPVVKPMEDPPAQLASYRGVVFDHLKVQVDRGPEQETPPLKVQPLLRLSGSTRAYMMFMAAVARKGKITLGDQEFTALLTQTGMITGRFDSPYTGLALIPTDPSRKLLSALMRPSTLSSLHWVKGEYYQISATPTGDKLTVAPFAGDCGLLKVSLANREGTGKLGLSGTLRAENKMLPVGDTTPYTTAEKLPEHKIPVGDYTPYSLAVDVGKLAASFSQNYYSMEEPHARLSKPPAGTLKIRKDKPLVLDFSGKPAVLFTAPTKGQTVKPGSTLRLRALIVDPELNLLVRGLDDTSQKLRERTYRTGGQTVTIPQYASLAPKVTITDSSGKQVAEGTMPFG